MLVTRMKSTMALIIALITTSAGYTQDNTDIAKPEIIHFGQDLSESRKSLATYCDNISVREIIPAEIPGTKNRQMQLDCEGFEMAGAKRLAEFVYRDDKLVLVWILVNESELPALRQKMITSYGTPSFEVNGAFTAFTSHRTALRADIPEFLFYSADVSGQFENWFSAASN